MLASDSDLEILREAAAGRTRQLVDLVVTGCAFSCCGRGWHRRDGYEQTYHGYIDHLSETSMSFMLYSPGIGTISYVLAVTFEEVADVQRA